MYMFSHSSENLVDSRFVYEVRQCSSENRQISENDVWLIAKAVSSLCIYRAKYLVLVKTIHKSTWPIIKRFSANTRIVRIHHSVNKPDSQPLRDEVELYVYDFFQESESWVFACLKFGIVSRNSIAYECLHIFPCPKTLCKLKRSDTDMRAHCASQNRSVFSSVTNDGVSGFYDCQTSRSGNSQSAHCFAYQVFSQHRT